MKTMGWTFSEYQRTPVHIVDEIEMFIKTENRVMSESMEKK